MFLRLSVSTRGLLGPQKQLFVCPGNGGISGCSKEPLHEPEGMAQNKRGRVDLRLSREKTLVWKVGNVELEKRGFLAGQGSGDWRS